MSNLPTYGTIDDLIGVRNSKSVIVDYYGLSVKRRALYRKRPDLWLSERFAENLKTLIWSSYDPELYKNHVWDGTKNPFYEMFKAVAEGNSVGFESGTGIGKTYWLARLLFWYLDCFDDSLVVTTAPKQSQLKQILWTEVAKAFPKFKKIRPKAELFSLRVSVDNEDGAASGYEAIGAVAGVKAGEESATRLQGFHRERMLFIIDEMAGIPKAILTAIKQTIADPKKNLIVGVGNPDNQNDALHDHCTGVGVRHIIGSSLDYLNVVLQNAGKEPVIPGAVTKESVEMRIREYGEKSNIIQSRVRGLSPEQTTGALIRREWILQCLNASNPDRQLSMNAVGVDVSDSEHGDKAAVCFGKGNTITDLKSFNAKANYLAYNLIYEIDEIILQNLCPPDHLYGIPTVKSYDIMPCNIGVDAVGVGRSTINSFIDKGYSGISALQGGQFLDIIPKDHEGRPLYRYAYLRDQMYYMFAQDLMNKEINIWISEKRILDEFIKQATNIKYTANSSNILIEKKDDLKKRLGNSPDELDSAVYWNFVRRYGWAFVNRE